MSEKVDLDERKKKGLGSDFLQTRNSGGRGGLLRRDSVWAAWCAAKGSAVAFFLRPDANK